MRLWASARDASSSRVAAGPCMPGTSGTSPVQLAIATISTMVLEPSTNSTSMRGVHVALRAASSSYSAGMASNFSGLFLPLPAQTIVEAERLGKADEFQGGGRLVAGGTGIDDARPCVLPH